MENLNLEKNQKFQENAGKRVNNILHDISILEPMARSNNYDYTKEEVIAMFGAIREQTDAVEKVFMKKFEEKEIAKKPGFSFGQTVTKEQNEEEDEGLIVETDSEDDV